MKKKIDFITNEKYVGSGVTARRVVDNNGSLQDLSFRAGKKKLASFVITGKIAKQLSAYYLIEKDLRSALAWQKLLGEMAKDHPYSPIKDEDGLDETDEMIRALFIASVLFYAKCFTQAQTRGTKLEKRDHISDELKSLHDGIMKVRDKFMVHSDSDHYETVTVNLIVQNLPNNEVQFLSICELIQTRTFDYNKYHFIDLIENVRTKVNAKIGQLNEKVYEEEVKPHGNDYSKKAKRQPKKVSN
jgi:hypothetical protein